MHSVAVTWSSPPARALLVFATAVTAGCVFEPIKEWPCYGPAENCEEGETGIYLHEEEGTDSECTFEHASPNNFLGSTDQDYVVSHCVEYSGPDAGKPLSMTGTGDCNVDASTSPGEPWNPEIHEWIAQTSQMDNGASIEYLCGKNAFSTVQFHFVPSTGFCSDYVDEAHNFLFFNNGYLKSASSTSNADCSWVAEDAARELSKPVGMLGGSEAGCSAGSATFDMVARHIKGHNTLGEAAVQLVPIADSNAVFPARAWLRTINVLDWGDIGMFRIASPGQDLTFASNGSVTGGIQISAPTTQQSLSVGTATMGAIMGTASVADGNELPRVTLSWSCEVGSPPHFGSIPNHTGYLLDLSSYGLNHRLVVWVDQGAKMIRVAPRGRFMDHVLMPYNSSGHFKGVIQPHNTMIEGEISFSGGNAVLDELTVTTVGLSPITVSSPITLSPL